jgi:hypothetical protein
VALDALTVWRYIDSGEHCRPSGRFVRTVAGTANNDATVSYQKRALDEGDVIASGTTDSEGYGTTPVERAQFIVDTIRTHLASQAYTHGGDNLSSIEEILGTEVRWCPACGTRLPPR